MKHIWALILIVIVLIGMIAAYTGYSVLDSPEESQALVCCKFFHNGEEKACLAIEPGDCGVCESVC